MPESSWMERLIGSWGSGTRQAFESLRDDFQKEMNEALADSCTGGNLDELDLAVLKDRLLTAENSIYNRYTSDLDNLIWQKSYQLSQGYDEVSSDETDLNRFLSKNYQIFVVEQEKSLAKTATILALEYCNQEKKAHTMNNEVVNLFSSLEAFRSQLLRIRTSTEVLQNLLPNAQTYCD